MSTQLKLRRGTTAQHSTFTGAEGEVTVDTTKDTLVVHDGTTAGGKPVLTEANPSYTGTLTGSTGVVNIGSGQVYKDASGNVGVGQVPVNSRRLTAATSGQTDLSIIAGSTSYGQLLFGYTGADNKGIVAYNNSDNSMQFFTNGAERARITSAGDFLFGKTTGDVTSAGIQFEAGLNYGRFNFTKASASGTGATPALNFYYAGTGVGQITNTSTGTAYVTTSDYRLKEDVAPMAGALDKVALLKPVTYKWKSDGSDSQGFIAHELQEIVPDCVVGVKDAVETYTDEDGNEATRPVYQGIDTSFLVATLTAAIQEQQAIITALTTRITALEGASAEQGGV
jgi:hypothetical protein